MCRQLYNILVRENRDTVLFLSRDGCLIMKLFKFLYPEFNSIYFHSSRRVNESYTKDYCNYVKSIYNKDKCILFDLHGSFKSGRKLFMELFHFDIETAGQYRNFSEFEKNDERGSNLFRGKFHKMGWDSKYENVDEAYADNCGIVPTYGRIVCISFGYLDNGQERISSFYGDDEKDIVEKFNNILKRDNLSA